MPPVAELLKDLEAYSKEEILVKAFARGATIGFRADSASVST
jgi:hypothetical protein